MHLKTLSLTAIAVAVGATQPVFASQQSDATGFTEGAHFTVKTRNMYMNRDQRAEGAAQSYGEEWAQGFVGVLESGFTQGTVGFGIDLLGQFAQKLDTGDGRTGGGTGLLEQGSSGAKDNQSELGGVLKMQISNTVLKYGTQITSVPVLGTSDSRLLPETVEGFSVNSKEFKDLTLAAGHFTGLSNRNQSSRDSGRMTSVDYVGGTYKITPQWGASLYYGDTDNYFRKYYVNTNYVLPLSDNQSLKFDFNGYDTKSTGQERSGELDNRIWSISAGYSVGAHTFVLAHQQVNGTGDYVYGPDGNASYVFANSVQYSDFNYEDEKSWQARYDINLATYGVPGLSFMTRYVKGTDFNTAATDNGKAWERDIEGRYVVQSGKAKDLSLRIRHASYRSSDRGGQIDEVRVITDYPFNVF